MAHPLPKLTKLNFISLLLRSAQLYFTGSAYFNRSMRLYAKTIGYSLSDHGLYPATREWVNGKMEVRSKGVGLKATTEAEIFALMGLNYVEPESRSCYDDVTTIGFNKKKSAFVAHVNDDKDLGMDDGDGDGDVVGAGGDGGGGDGGGGDGVGESLSIDVTKSRMESGVKKTKTKKEVVETDADAHNLHRMLDDDDWAYNNPTP